MKPEKISIRRVKLTARQQLKKSFSDALKANFFMIVFQVIQVWILALSILTIIMTVNDPSSSSTSGSNNPLGPENIITVLARAVMTLFVWSALWTTIDAFQAPNSKVTFRQTLQSFTNGHFGVTFLLALVQNILLKLWTVLTMPLLSIPGIVKRFSYSQTYYAYKMDLLFNRKQRSLTDYITISRRVMDGHKWELFRLELSFFFWHLLGILTFGLGYIYVLPYLYTSRVVYSTQIFAQAVKEP
ncbi:DUF975 family protein [Eupransor demetentiae]|uniref:Uncharacterized membrane protein n=1 Tax=Eupransor demetentiae TaxID=3109584 RepID=A0ABP0EN06_9LACO|nr:Uncharacterized membrane protein [Lactobacillaceae bacterium LMG 33000]